MNINDYITFSLYCNVCRSLFEKHKLMFAFLVCIRILMNDGQIDMVSKSPWSFDGIPSEQLKPSLFDPLEQPAGWKRNFVPWGWGQAGRQTRGLSLHSDSKLFLCLCAELPSLKHLQLSPDCCTG